jgi:hypothetical protein
MNPIADDFPAIAAVINAPEADTPEPEWSLGEIEPALFELRANIGILGHLATAENEVTQDEWQFVEGNLINCHRRLEALWLAAWDQRKAEQEAHDAALVAAKTRTAAPGSASDVAQADAVWALLRAAATVTLRRCREARPAAAEEA